MQNDTIIPIMTVEDVDASIAALKHKMYCLECSDDRLFTNANGNLPTYEGWRDQLTTLYRLREDLV